MLRSRQRIRDDHKERQLVLGRLRFCIGLVIVLSLLLAARYVQLQVVQHQSYVTRSDNNRIRLQALPPTRGLIYDRNGEILADNRPAYRLEIIPEKVGNMSQTLDQLSTLIDITEEDRKRFQKRRRENRRFDQIPLRFALSDQEVARIAVNRHLLPGVEVVPYLTRFYPYGSLLAHVTGYVGRINQQDIPADQEDNYRGTTHTGHSALERYYEPLLHGQAGWQRVETNAEGRILKTLAREDPERGQDLFLSLDLELQRTAAVALQGLPGAVVALEVGTGDILALVSEPSYDPNLFVNGISNQNYQRLLNTPGKPLFNRALQGSYEPGSTLKPFIAIAALEAGTVSTDVRYFSSGKFFLPNSERPYRDWLKGGHGWVNIPQALEQSVNTAFYQMALDLGIDRIYSALQPFNFGTKTGIDLPGEARGLLPSREWKRAHYDQPWFPGETVITGIGQGYTLVTPVQLASATAALAGGVWHRPQIKLRSREPAPIVDTLTEQEATAERAITPSSSNSQLLLGEIGSSGPEEGDYQLRLRYDDNQAYWDLIHSGMEMVIHGTRGTARAIAPSHYRMAGKTGTAQVFTQDVDEEYVESQVAAHLRHHALFIAFAPVEAPQIAVAVVAEHGGSGSRSAAPVARAVIDAWMATHGR